MKSLKWIFLVVFSIFLLELAVRVSGVYQSYSEANFNRYDNAYGQNWPKDYFLQRKDSIGYNQTEFQFSCPTNNLGLREAKSFETPKTDSYRILFLGDSFTEGVGATCGNNMPEIFQSYLSDSFQVFNAGVVGSDPFFYLNWYDEYFEIIDANQVIIVLNNSDISDYIFRGGEERFSAENNYAQFKKAPFISLPYKYSHLFRFVLHFILKYDFTLLSPKQYDVESNQAIEAIAKKINTWKEDHSHVKLAVVIQPYAFAVKKNVPGHNKLPKIISLLDEEIEIINLYPSMFAVINKENYLDYSWKLDGHFNDKGYELFAKELWLAWN